MGSEQIRKPATELIIQKLGSYLELSKARLGLKGGCLGKFWGQVLFGSSILKIELLLSIFNSSRPAVLGGACGPPQAGFFACLPLGGSAPVPD